ncbi:hypothetical protein B0H12DRAFT_1101278 [Mycena haematopus]|nr:hypothetical protein B0H12DRAFT_1101278 [Mycena haematopus]
MSLNDRMKNEPAAAPLRTKIAQFESKGGVPVPRGKFDSFGSAAPPPQQNKQRRELYGNRMKPVWVPSTKVGSSPLARARNERREERAAWTVDKEEDETADNHLPSPPESPTVESERGSDPPSPASIIHQQQFTVAEPEQEAEEDVPPEPPRQEYVYEIPSILGEDEEDEGEEELLEDIVLPSPLAIDDSPPVIPIKTEPEQITSSAVEHRPSSPPLPPSPPLSPTPPPLSALDELHGTTSSSRIELHVDTGYGTVSIQAPRRTFSSPPSPRTESRSHYAPPPRTSSRTSSSTTSSSRTESRPQHEPPQRTSSSAASSPLTESHECFTFSHSQGQTFSSVVYPRVHETPARQTQKRLPPPPPSPQYTNRASNADLTVLVANAAALERRLVAGELPADVLKRLSVRPVQDLVPVVEEERSSRPPRADTPPEHARAHAGEKKHSGFRSALRGAARSKSRKRDKGDSDSSPPPAHVHADSSTWFGDVSWRKFASTTRHKSPLESAPSTLIATP